MKARGKQPLEKRPNSIKAIHGIQVGTVLKVADNSGCKILKVIGVKGIGGRLNKFPSAAPGDVIVCSVKKGKPEMRKTVVLAIVIRQKQTTAREDGTKLVFESNAAVIINGKGELKGSQILGPVLKEVCEMWPKIASHASTIY